MTLGKQRHTRCFAEPGTENLIRGVGNGEAYRDGDGTRALPRVADAGEDDGGVDGAGRVRRVPRPRGVIRKDASAARRWAASLLGGAPVHDLASSVVFRDLARKPGFVKGTGASRWGLGVAGCGLTLGAASGGWG